MDKPKMFSKQSQSDALFRKISNTARKADNTVARVGSFLIDSAKTVGLGALNDPLKRGVDAVHNIRNGLEKAIKTPPNQLRYH